VMPHTMLGFYGVHQHHCAETSHSLTSVVLCSTRATALDFSISGYHGVRITVRIIKLRTVYLQKEVALSLSLSDAWREATLQGLLACGGAKSVDKWSPAPTMLSLTNFTQW
jgi:hypothetical protein